MSIEPERPHRWSTLSSTHTRPDLRDDNPLYARAGSASVEFAHRANGLDPEHTNERGSSMVKRQQARPVLRPSPSLAYGPDGAAFDAQWNEERRAARPRDRGR